MAPIGYLNQKDKHGKSIIVIDEERAPIIKRLFEEYATGLHTAQSLLILACKLGLTAKETYSEETPQRKRFISRTKIYEILRNPFYAGIMCVKGKLMPHIHGKIIDKKLYDKVQQIMDAKGMESEIHKHQQKYKVKKFAFRGLVLCGRCHHLMSPDCKTKTNGKQYTYLRCYNKCGQMPINETILLKQLEDEIFSKIQISPTIYNLLKKSITQSIEDEKKINISARKKIDADIAVIDNRLERLWECYLDRDINKARYELEKQKYLEQKKDLQAKAEKFSDISGELKENVTKAMDFVVNLPKLMKIATPDEKNTLLKKLLTNCVLDGKVLKYEIKAPFDKLLSCTNYKKWKDVAMENLEEFGEVE